MTRTGKRPRRKNPEHTYFKALEAAMHAKKRVDRKGSDVS